MDARAAAEAFVATQYPECLAAFLGGSVVRGEATSTSDLDLVVITLQEGAPHRESFRAFGWPIEAFVHTPDSCQRFFESDARRRCPALAVMCSEGLIVHDVEGWAGRVRAMARAVAEAGPERLAPAEVDRRRYMLTDALDDLVGATDPAEAFFCAHLVAQMSANLILGCARAWEGQGKWTLRALRRYDEGLAEGLAAALAAWQGGQAEPLVCFAREALERAGGRLWEGYFARPTDG